MEKPCNAKAAPAGGRDVDPPHGELPRPSMVTRSRPVANAKAAGSSARSCSDRRFRCCRDPTSLSAARRLSPERGPLARVQRQPPDRRAIRTFGARQCGARGSGVCVHTRSGAAHAVHRFAPCGSASCPACRVAWSSGYPCPSDRATSCRTRGTTGHVKPSRQPTALMDRAGRLNPKRHVPVGVDQHIYGSFPNARTPGDTARTRYGAP